MSISVERLRIWLLVGAGLLVVVIAAFLGYAHYRAHRFLTDLPKKLGIDIRQEANGYTLSKSAGPNTVYTIHAAKESQLKNGKIILRDVGIVVYGKKQNRADRIYGSEFEYDSATGVIRAEGEVHIDLQAPQANDANAKSDYAAGKDLQGIGAHAAGKDESKHDRLIHVTTSGLVFLQKLGVAATDKDIEFASGGMTGHAVGADYNSDTGVVVLHSAVRVNGLQHDRPVMLTASRAVLDRPGQTMVLSQAMYVSVGEQAGGGEGRTAAAQHVVVHLRSDGTAERVEADGEVTLTGAAGGSLVAPRGEAVLNAQNQPQSAVMSGGVKYVADELLRQAKGAAGEARVAFDKKGRPEHAVMTGAVHLRERLRAWDAATEPWNERELNAGTVDLALATDSGGKTLLRDVKATGDARLNVENAAALGGMTRSEMSGDVLTAHFVRLGAADHIAEVHGDGHAALRTVNATGVVNTSSADSMVAHFRPVANADGRGSGTASKGQQGKKDSFGGSGKDKLSDAVEQGHVVVTRLPVRKPADAAAPMEEHATAQRATYDGELERTTLTGNVQLNNGSSVLWADRVITEQQTGDATADGAVKVTYGQVGSAQEPVHVLAGNADLKHDSQIATFHGAAGNPARLWQGASQVDAPVLQFDQKERRLLAHGEGQGAPMAVHTVLVSSGALTKPDVAKADVTKTGAVSGGKQNVVRVASRELVYSDVARKAEFTGGVEVDSRDGIMRSQQVVVYLQPAPGGGKAADVKQGAVSGAGGGFMGGSVERIVATGRIEMQQPGRRATGEQLVYTASDGMFVLTGTAAALPKVADDQRGTVTGTSLRFHSGDDNIVVSNGGENGSGQRVRTETRVKNRQ